MTLPDLRSLLIVAKAYRQAGHEQHAQAALDDAIAAVAEMAEAQKPALKCVRRECNNAALCPAVGECVAGIKFTTGPARPADEAGSR